MDYKDARSDVAILVKSHCTRESAKNKIEEKPDDVSHRVPGCHAAYQLTKVEKCSAAMDGRNSMMSY